MSEGKRKGKGRKKEGRKERKNTEKSKISYSFKMTNKRAKIDRQIIDVVNPCNLASNLFKLAK